METSAQERNERSVISCQTLCARGTINKNDHICWANKRSSEARPEHLHRLRAATSEGAVPKLIKQQPWHRILKFFESTLKNGPPALCAKSNQIAKNCTPAPHNKLVTFCAQVSLSHLTIWLPNAHSRYHPDLKSLPEPFSRASPGGKKQLKNTVKMSFSPSVQKKKWTKSGQNPVICQGLVELSERVREAFFHHTQRIFQAHNELPQNTENTY